LLKHLEKKLVSQSPPKTDIIIIDSIFFFDIPSTFGKLALHIMEKLCRTEAKEVHLVFDSYKSPSIKDCDTTQINLKWKTEQKNQPETDSHHREFM
jgi:hypothetical protein